MNPPAPDLDRTTANVFDSFKAAVPVRAGS